MPLPKDYLERVYAGVLGKIIGVYLGRPFEGWTYDRISTQLGEISYYVNDRIPHHPPLLVTDDDISGTFTFLRALPDYDCRPDLTPAQIGQTWLNYLIEKRTVLWWGGLGNSTEHTAYLRLKNGIPAPWSGSRLTNGQVVSEQIGAQIFIDGWAMVFPGDPERAADMARRAASVSHDGEAIYGAQVLAAMESLAFIEPDLNRLLDVAVSFIPADSVIYRLIADLRTWRAADPDWRAARHKIQTHYGYDRYGGNCHMVPNHALIHLGLLYGDDDFQKALLITNTAGWDTDCNSGNVGCLMGIKLGLAGLEAGPDWRGPVADRLYLPTADGGRAITDAVAEAYRIANLGLTLAGAPLLTPKSGARFHFELPGAVQGFTQEADPAAPGLLTIQNVAGHSRQGQRSLAVQYRKLAPGCPARFSTATFIPPEAVKMPGYGLLASPTLYPGQTLRAVLSAAPENPSPTGLRLYLTIYGADDQPERVYGPLLELSPGQEGQCSWLVPDLDGAPVAAVGFELTAPAGVGGTVYLDSLTWDGIPALTFRRPAWQGSLWRQAWVNAVDHFEPWAPEAFRLIQDQGVGLLIQGCREWSDYTISAEITPHMVKAFGLAGRVQGLRRYYALRLCAGERAQLVKVLDGETILAETAFPWELGRPYALRLTLTGPRLRASVAGQPLFDLTDSASPLLEGALALLCEEGRLATESVTIEPAAL
jgi:ADP-ribosylglycohydrolase